jgi:hypothetical protein
MIGRPRSRRLLPFATLVVTLALSAPAAHACPVCHTETGKEVRAGIFNEDFRSNLLTTLLPFPIVLGITAALHFGFTPKVRASDDMPPGPSVEAH